MGKEQKKSVVQNKDLLSRINFLHQASILMAKAAPTVSQNLVLDMKIVARKGQLAVNRDIKRQLCKRCHTVLLEGVTSTRHIENRSKCMDASQDVLIIQCSVCMVKKRYHLRRAEERLETSVTSKPYV